MNKKPKEYKGKRIIVRYDVDVCIHAAECVNGLPAVFNTSSRPWVDPDGAPADAVAEQVRRCPSGALSFEWIDGAEEDD